MFSLFWGCGFAAAADNHGHAPHWEYEGKAGPAQWGNLEKDFVTCKLGGEQSPIDISTKATEKAKLSVIQTSHNVSVGEWVNNGRTIQINLADVGSATDAQIETLEGKASQLIFASHAPALTDMPVAQAPWRAVLYAETGRSVMGIV